MEHSPAPGARAGLQLLLSAPGLAGAVAFATAQPRPTFSSEVAAAP